jgi:hypothetical protein
VSSRLPPKLLADRKSASVLLFDQSKRRQLETGEEDSKNGETKNHDDVCIFYLDNYELEERPLEYKGSMICTKMVYGGAFSGYPERRISAENATVNELVERTLDYFKRSRRSQDTTT